ncbi:uncharacterized protein PITG_22806, partial [Phytophthora infestans T30-4]
SNPTAGPSAGAVHAPLGAVKPLYGQGSRVTEHNGPDQLVERQDVAAAACERPVPTF